MIKADFTPIWYTIPEFARERPVSPYRKEQALAADVPNKIKNVHVLARAELKTKGEDLGFTVLRITADDYYKVYVNGVFSGQGPAPAYPENYYYNEIDISKMLRKGSNLIAVHVYYQGLVNRVWNSGDGRLALAADVVSAADEERKEQLSWNYRISGAYSGEVIGYDTQFLENFDSRLWDEGWNKAAACGSEEEFCRQNGWLPMVLAEWADYRLKPQPVKMLDVYEIRPRLIEKREDGSWFVDVGQEVTGSVLVRARGKSGQKVRIFCGEELREDGSVRSDMRCNCRYEEIWTLAEGECRLEPYDYKAFRYVSIEAEKGAELLDVSIRIRHYPFDASLCTFHCSDTRLNRIFELCKNTIRCGVQEAYLDCPSREKGQYLGDAIVSARSHVWLTGSVEMLRKCIDQFALTAQICPGLMAVAPGSLMQEIGDFSLLWPELLMTDYFFTKDKNYLRQHYETAKNVLGYFEKYRTEDGLLQQVSEKWNLVDWPENLRDGYDFVLSRPIVAPGCHNVINALFIGAAKTLAEMETILGYPVTYDWKRLRDVYVRAFFRPQEGLFADSTCSDHAAVHSNIYPLYFGLVPEEAIDRIVKFLMEKGLCCGVMIGYFFLKGLARNGYYEEMYALLVNESEHGWMNMLREGATTCYEAWGKNQKWNTSLCHPWATAPISIIVEEMAGIRPDLEGEAQKRVHPHIPDDIPEFCLEIGWLN